MNEILRFNSRQVQRHTVAFLGILAFTLAIVLAPLTFSSASSKDWSSLSEEISSNVDQAVSVFNEGNTEQAVELIKKARYELYVDGGMEDAVATHLSGRDANRTILEFGLLNKAIKEGDSEAVEKHTKSLHRLLHSSVQSLSGEELSVEDLQVSPGKWGTVASDMIELLDQAGPTYDNGDARAAVDLVNDAYYRHYEVSGFEKMTMARISGVRVSKVELEFALIKKAMADGKDEEVHSRLADLKPMLIQDANTLDGFDGTGGGESNAAGSSGFTLFIASFTVILREGLEAILVLVAVISYLVKAGHRDKTYVVWIGAGAALVLSIIMAFAISALTSLAGKSQELIEGITALLAVAMLIWVSNWMLGKSNAQAWDKFIKDKTDTSLSKGSLFSLAFVAFLAVVREGAETILFYQPILAMAEDDTHLVWLGLIIGAVILVGIYAAIRLLSIRIPLRPFFLITSALLAIMALTFTGNGIRELQEADVISVTPIDGLPTIDLLGVFPRVENLTAQAVVLLIMVVLLVLGYRKQKRVNQLAPAEQ